MTQRSGVGRPSNRDERYEQIMQALVCCVSKFGLEGTTLKNVADEAGLKRPLIRHHLGNRDDMIEALHNYVLARFDADVDNLVRALPQKNKADALVDILFSDRAANDPDMTMAFAALTSSARENAGLRERCRKCILRFEEVVAGALSNDIPDNRAAGQAAHGIVALYFNATSLSTLQMPNIWTAQAKELARELIKMTPHDED